MILGLDIGANSLGWCLVETNADGQPCAIAAAGVRCFPAGVEGDLARGREESRTVKRRQARLMRRQTWRRRRRKQKLFRLLQSLDLLPKTPRADPTSIHECIQSLDSAIRRTDPDADSHRGQQVLLHHLRKRALSERLSRHEFGRALYHLAQRRGFLSNRKQAAKDDDETGKVKEGIASLADAIRAAGAPTLGSYLATLDPTEERIRTRWTSRQMYEDEFHAIWTAQAKHHEGLDEDARKRVFQAIFFQRPLKDQSHLIGFCRFERAERRAPIAHPVYQRFRLLQTVNHLRIIAPGEPPAPLTSPQRAMLIAELETTAELTKARVKKLLGVPANARLSIEEGGETKIVGNRTDAKLRGIFGARWDTLSAEDRLRVVDDVLSFEKEKALQRRGETHWGLPTEAAGALAKSRLEEGYAPISAKAILRLIPHLERGLSYSEAVEAEYPSASAATEVHDLLPDVLSDHAFPDLRNPTVLRALSEVRRVVNAIVRKHGKPDFVRIELARDLKRGRKQRKDLWTRMRDQEQRRAQAANVARTAVPNPTPRDIEKVLLWEECGKRCPYTGRTISMRDLLSDAAFDIEHIIPFSRSLDDSLANKTLCHHEENRNTKRNRTPFEAYASDAERWEQIIARVRAFDSPLAAEKLRRFLLEDVGEELSDEFTKRHLNDTRHASKLAAEYVGRLYGGVVDAGGTRRVQATSGALTAFLRRRWELNKLLDDGDFKTRTDHRHHAVDALVVALTTPAAVKALADAARQAERVGGRRLFGEIEPPWPGFLEEARRTIQAVTVSHRVDRRLNGPLHEETIYGPPRPFRTATGEVKQVRHIRKALSALSEADIEEIVDPGIRDRVKRRLAELRERDPRLAAPAKAFADASNHPAIETASGRAIPIHRVRIRKTVNARAIGSGPSLRYVAPGSNHHMAIVALLDESGADTRWDGHVVTRLEAIDRWRRGQPVIQRDWGRLGRFLFSLASGDSVRLTLEDGSRPVCVVRTVSGRQVEVRRCTDARTAPEVRKAGKAGGRLIFSIDGLRRAACEKVNVGALGDVTVARD